jgi:hypothetical protein
VTVITDDRTQSDRRERAMQSGARVVTGDFRSATVRAEAGVTTATAVVLTTSRDLDNLQTALDIRDEAPAVAVVMRHSDPNLSRRFEADFGIRAAFAPAELAADAFIDAALAAPSADARPGGRDRGASMPRRPVPAEFIAIPILLLGLYIGAIVVFHSTLGIGWLDAAYFATSVVTTVGFGDFNLQSRRAG